MRWQLQPSPSLYSPNLPPVPAPSIQAATTAPLAREQQILSSRALEKRPVRDPNVDLEAQLRPHTYAHDLFVQPPEDVPTALPQLTEPPAALQRRSLLNTLFPRLLPPPPPRGSRTARPAPSRLLNPINYVPRPTPVSVPPTHSTSAKVHKAVGSRETRTLLTLPESRRSRQNSPTSPQFVEHSPIEGTESNRTSIGLPPSRRKSLGLNPEQADTMGDVGRELDGVQIPDAAQPRDVEANLPPLPPLPPQPTGQSILGQDYGMSPDDLLVHPPKRSKSYRSLHAPKSLNSLRSGSRGYNASSPDSREGGHATADNTDPAEVAEELAWGPSHPCFPHLNSHVPLHSPEYDSTRIIRIKRDWMVRGDLAPAYSNLYPEILDPALPEHEFRTIIHHINKTLVEAFDPYSMPNLVDAFLGLVTGWLWEDFGMAGVKGKLQRLEQWIDDWNRRMGERDGVKFIPLRRTGYMNLDIQIPDPQLKVVGEDERSALGTTTDVKDAESAA